MPRRDLVHETNALLIRINSDLLRALDVASIEGDQWAAATITAARRTLGGDEPSNQVRIAKRKRGR